MRIASAAENHLQTPAVIPQQQCHCSTSDKTNPDYLALYLDLWHIQCHCSTCDKINLDYLALDLDLCFILCHCLMSDKTNPDYLASDLDLHSATV